MAERKFYTDVEIDGELIAKQLSVHGEYSFPTTDGTTGYILATDGAGNVDFVNPGSLLILTSGSIINGTGLTWTQVSPGVLRGDVNLTPFSTSNLVEGSRLYFTNERVDDRVSALIQNGTGLTWTYNDPLNTLTGNVSLAPFSTTNLAEGTNLYFTNERVDDRVAVLLQPGLAGTGPASITWIYNDSLNLLTPTVSLAPFTTSNLAEGSNLYFTNERVDDRVAALIQNSATVTWTYNDLLNTLTANATAVPLEIQDNGAIIGTRGKLDFIDGSFITFNVSDDPINSKIQVQANLDPLYLEDLIDVFIGSPGPVAGDVLTYDGANWTTGSSAVVVLDSGVGSSVRKSNNNIASGDYSTVSGGYTNTATNTYSTTSGGYDNCSTGYASTLAGGQSNAATCTFSTIGGGVANTSSNQCSTVSGGYLNVSSAGGSTISGGLCNSATGGFSKIGGGLCNTASNCYSSILGGAGNVSSGIASTLGGGAENLSCGTGSSLLGGRCNETTSCFSTVVGGICNVEIGFGDKLGRNFIGGGETNYICANGSTIAGGNTNSIYAGSAVIGGGVCNSISANGNVSAILGGQSNSVDSQYSAVLGGVCNSVTGSHSAILGGCGNTAACACSGIFGCNITDVQGNTFHVNNFAIIDQPTLDSSNIGVLVRGSNGLINQRYLGGIYSQTANSGTVTATTTETTIIGTGVGSLSVPANGFTAGDSFLVKMNGIISNVNGETIRIRVKETGTGATLADSGAISLDTTTNKNWMLEIMFTVRAIGAATVAAIMTHGNFKYTKNTGLDLEGFGFSTLNTTTFNTTVLNTLDITVQWGSNNAGNSIYSDIFTLVKEY
jgi:hypothetical protein